MKPRHPKYTLKEGDTIQSITKSFDVDEDIWKRYHNNMCRLDEIIREDIPKNLTGVYLLPELWDKEDALNFAPAILEFNDFVENKSNDKIQFGINNTLVMKFCPQVLYYEVLTTLFKSNKVNTIKNVYAVRWIEKNDIGHIIEINKTTDTLINDRAVDLMAEELAVKAASALYPLQLIVTQKDGITGIHNFQEIQKRWESVTQNIKEYYSGETLEKYLRMNDMVMNDKGILIRSLSNDWFLHAYFNRIYQTYGSTYSFSNTVQVPLIFDAEGVNYKLNQTINDSIDENGFINIIMDGEFSDERSLLDLENHLSFARDEYEIPVRGKYSAEYILEPKYNTIIKSILRCSLKLEKQKDVSVIVTRIKK